MAPGSGVPPTLFTAAQLDAWRYVGPFMTQDMPDVADHEDVSCPDFFPLAVDGDPRPSYALVRAEEEEMPHGHIVRFDYERERTIAALKKTPLPKALREDFSEGNKRRFAE